VQLWAKCFPCLDSVQNPFLVLPFPARDTKSCLIFLLVGMERECIQVHACRCLLHAHDHVDLVQGSKRVQQGGKQDAIIARKAQQATRSPALVPGVYPQSISCKKNKSQTLCVIHSLTSSNMPYEMLCAVHPQGVAVACEALRRLLIKQRLAAKQNQCTLRRQAAANHRPWPQAGH
jgi:hypothetical protein